MRPDEHKRRKNEKYKKKHDIPSGSNKDNEQKQKSKNTGLKEHVKVVDRQEQAIGKSKPEVQKDESEEGSRRLLADNWERYEEEIDEDRFMPEIRGEDFNKLLEESGSSSSMFRFKDEEDWNDEASESERSNQGFTMDFNKIYQAISCAPLYERLGLSKDLFTDDQLEEMTGLAKQCLKRYEETSQEANNKNKTIETANTVVKTKALPEPTSNLTVVTSSKCTVNSSHAPNKSGPVDDRVKPDINSLEDDLDSLLSFDTPHIDNRETVPAPSSNQKRESSGPTAISNSSPSKRDTTKTKTTSNTKDWLDELLGD